MELTLGSLKLHQKSNNSLSAVCPFKSDIIFGNKTKLLTRVNQGQESRPSTLEGFKKKKFIHYKGGIGRISVFYGLQLSSYRETKYIEQALGWAEGPTHVYRGGMFDAATPQLLQEDGIEKQIVFAAEGVGKECESHAHQVGKIPRCLKKSGGWSEEKCC